MHVNSRMLTGARLSFAHNSSPSFHHIFQFIAAQNNNKMPNEATPGPYSRASDQQGTELRQVRNPSELARAPQRSTGPASHRVDERRPNPDGAGNDNCCLYTLGGFCLVCMGVLAISGHRGNGEHYVPQKNDTVGMTTQQSAQLSSQYNKRGMPDYQHSQCVVADCLLFRSHPNSIIRLTYYSSHTRTNWSYSATFHG
jgi:hypothetical protein